MTSPRNLDRQTGKFATVYAAGRLLIEFEILRIDPEELGLAILQCHGDSSRFVDDHWRPSEQPRTPLSRLQNFVRVNANKFIVLKGNGESVESPATAIGYLNGRTGSKELLLPRARLVNVAGGSGMMLELVRDLTASGIITTNGGGKHARAAVKRMVNGQRVYLYVFDVDRLLTA